VRNSEKAQNVLNAKSVQPYRAQLEMVIVNDILAEGAFDDAAEGMDYVLHIASPVTRPVSCLSKNWIQSCGKQV
jgi:hypothetical protein